MKTGVFPSAARAIRKKRRMPRKLFPNHALYKLGYVLKGLPQRFQIFVS
jgi:hypothetical protein